MSVKGPILIIEDDANDLDVMAAAIRGEVDNAIESFTDAREVLEYLMTTKERPFLILCDIRMPGLNGLEFRNAINQNDFLRKKSVPFLFYTAAVSQEIVDEAYDLTVQGFFEKPATFPELQAQIKAIITYWKLCIHPNSF